MSLPKPNLDDKTFDRLIEEARSLIPRYAPAWTDHNLSDPGITLMELFAWLTEALLYRVNLIQDRHRLAYLRLLGFDLRGGRPAGTDLTFESPDNLSLEKGHPLWARTETGDICFELDEAIEVRPLVLEKVIVDETTRVLDRTALNTRGDQFYPVFGLNVPKDASLYLAFDRGPESLTFFCYLFEEDLIARGFHGEEKEYAFSNSRLRWEISSSGEGGWRSVFPCRDGTEGFKRSGRLVFDHLDGWTPATIPLWSDPGRTVGNTWFWLRCVVEESEFEYPPRLHAIRLNTVAARHGETLTAGEAWTGDGSPEQILQLKRFPVLDDSLVLSVDGTPWSRVPAFDGSGPEDRHFVLRAHKGEIDFGDGLYGKAPPEGATIRVERYRVGGGQEGNIKAGRQWRLEGHPDVRIRNDLDATGGRDPETIEGATARLLGDMKTPYAAVTSPDFEYLAKNTPGLRIAKARAIPNHDPAEGVKKGTVTVAVIPYTPLDFLERPPAPSPEFLKRICNHLDSHRLLGTEIRVVGALYVRVQVTLQVTSTGAFPEETLRSAILERLNRFLHPVRGWKDGNGWPLGRPVYRAEIYELLDGIGGVDCIYNVLLSGDAGCMADREGNLVLKTQTTTIYSGRHTVTVIAKQGECRKDR